MMLYQSFVVLAVAGLASAATPAGFQPGSTTDLIVAYTGGVALNGAVEAQTGESSLYQLASLTS